MKTQYYISGGKSNWEKVTAKTLRGAKAACSRTFAPSVGGIMEVGQLFGEGMTERIERVAVKHGHDTKWQE